MILENDENKENASKGGSNEDAKGMMKDVVHDFNPLVLLLQRILNLSCLLIILMTNQQQKHHHHQHQSFQMR